MRISSLRSLFPVALLLVLPLSGCTTEPAISAMQPATVYIVRHAEKGDGQDPSLTAAGEARARALLDQVLLPHHIYSTDTVRTRSTAQPLAERHGIPVDIYDHRDPEGLAARVQAHGGTTLIVGHSNTIAELAAAFGAEPGEPVGEDEYDRLYVIRLTEPVSGEIRRYGN